MPTNEQQQSRVHVQRQGVEFSQLSTAAANDTVAQTLEAFFVVVAVILGKYGTEVAQHRRDVEQMKKAG